MERTRGRQAEREEHDRAELAHCACCEEVGAEPGLELAAVGEDRDQGADRGRGQGGSRVEQREHDSGGGQKPADRVGDQERETPSEQAEPQRLAADPAQVDLIAGEEEEHPEAETGEEIGEAVDARSVEHLGTDDHAEDELGDDGGQQQTAPGDQRRDGPGDGGGDHDDHERPRVDPDLARVDAADDQAH